MTLATLADVQTLMRHLPEDRRERSIWRYTVAQLESSIQIQGVVPSTA